MLYNSYFWITIETIDTLKKPHSEAIIHLQLIEYYLKWCYALMHKGKVQNNFQEIKKMPMGKFIDNFKILDFSDNNPYLNNEDYKHLRKVTKKRNFYVHKFFTEFLIAKNNNDYETLKKLYEDLQNDLKIMKDLYNSVLKFYNKILDVYKRNDG